MSARRAVTQKQALAYRNGPKSERSRILDQVVELTGWHRDYARAALRSAATVKVAKPRKPRPPVYGPELVAALAVTWMVLRCPAGKRLAPMLAVVVPMLRRDGELDLTDDQAALLCAMSPATIDRRLADERLLAGFRGQ